MAVALCFDPMNRTAIALLCLSCALAAPAFAQKSVPVTSEPHHHLVYTGERLRVFRVEVPADSSTLIHEHAVDYFWIAVGASEFVNASVGKDEVKVIAPDGSVHFTRGGFSHLARVNGTQPFHNITVELPQAQTHPRNLCEAVLPAEPTDCPAAMKAAAKTFTGATARPEFETDQVRVTLLTIAQNETVEIAKSSTPPTLVVVDDIDGTTQMTCTVPAGSTSISLHAHSGDTYPGRDTQRCALHNFAKTSVRFLAVEFRTSPR
jgi:hypothetical protein